MRARVVTIGDDGELVTTEFEGDVSDFVIGVEGLGFAQAGVERNPSRRAELLGAPKFHGLAGPMWDGGGVLRWESWEVQNLLSA